MLGTGIVLTGGSAKLTGMVELAEEIFHMPVRLGVPQYSGALSEVVRNSSYATGIGLVLFGLQRPTQQKRSSRSLSNIPAAEFINKMKRWFSVHWKED